MEDIIKQIELLDKLIVISNNLTLKLSEQKVKLYKQLEEEITKTKKS